MVRIVLKKPGVKPEIVEVEGIREINKILGNVDEQGNGWSHGSSDTRMAIGPGIEEYCKADAINNFAFKQNLWNHYDSAILFGNIIFAGYDHNYDICSLTDDQIKYCFDYINSKVADVSFGF